MSFITTDDDFGIRQMLREIFVPMHKKTHGAGEYLELWFNVWMNQFLPPVWYESTGTIQRHIDEIRAVPYNTVWVWKWRGDDISCDPLTERVAQEIKLGKITLPTYLEIEQAKQRWQNTAGYNKERGFSAPIEEEVIQLRIQKKSQ